MKEATEKFQVDGIRGRALGSLQNAMQMNFAGPEDALSDANGSSHPSSRPNSQASSQASFVDPPFGILGDLSGLVTMAQYIDS